MFDENNKGYDSDDGTSKIRININTPTLGPGSMANLCSDWAVLRSVSNLPSKILVSGLLKGQIPKSSIARLLFSTFPYSLNLEFTDNHVTVYD